MRHSAARCTHVVLIGPMGSGKSTVAHALIERLAEFGRNCSLLDGDEIRTHLSKGLGFSREEVEDAATARQTAAAPFPEPSVAAPPR